MIHKTRPIFSTQFHPEAKGGPLDSSYLFDAYLKSVKEYKETNDVLKGGRRARPDPLMIDLLAKERVGVAPPNLRL
jgi:carbamoyl-phosphate synthase small subunit